MHMEWNTNRERKEHVLAAHARTEGLLQHEYSNLQTKPIAVSCSILYILNFKFLTLNFFININYISVRNSNTYIYTSPSADTDTVTTNRPWIREQALYHYVTCAKRLNKRHNTTSSGIITDHRAWVSTWQACQCICWRRCRRDLFRVAPGRRRPARCPFLRRRWASRSVGLDRTSLSTWQCERAQRCRLKERDKRATACSHNKKENI